MVENDTACAATLLPLATLVVANNTVPSTRKGIHRGLNDFALLSMMTSVDRSLLPQVLRTGTVPLYLLLRRRWMCLVTCGMKLVLGDLPSPHALLID